MLSCGGQKENKVTNENKEDMTQITYHRVQVEDCKGQSVRTVVFYREAGNPENLTILLLHGFPSSSHMFRELATCPMQRFISFPADTLPSKAIIRRLLPLCVNF